MDRVSSVDSVSSRSNMEEAAGIGAGLLFDSVRLAKLRMIRFILEGVDGHLVNARDIKGRTPLIMCCFIREEISRCKAFTLILKYGADTNLCDDEGRDALSYACEVKCNDLVRILVRSNVNPDTFDRIGNTPLIYSADVGNDTAIDLLIRHFRRLGLHVDHVNKEGFTALLMAAKMGNSHCAQLLVLQGKASLLHRDRVYGMSAEQWLNTHGLSLTESLKYACRAAKLEKVRKVLSVIQYTKKRKNPPEKKAVANKVEPPIVSTKPAQKITEIADRRRSLPCDINSIWEDDIATEQEEYVRNSQRLTEFRSPKVKEHRRPRVDRSASLCIPSARSVQEPRRKFVEGQSSLESSPELETCRRRLNHLSLIEKRRFSVEKSEFDKVLGRLSDSEGSSSSADEQTASRTSVEKLEDEIATLF